MRGSAAARLLGLRVRIPRVMDVCCECCVCVTGRSLVQRNPTDCSVIACGLEGSRMKRPRFALSCCVREKKISIISMNISIMRNTNVEKLCIQCLLMTF